MPEFSGIAVGERLASACRQQKLEGRKAAIRGGIYVVKAIAAIQILASRREQGPVLPVLLSRHSENSV